MADPMSELELDMIERMVVGVARPELAVWRHKIPRLVGEVRRLRESIRKHQKHAEKTDCLHDCGSCAGSDYALWSAIGDTECRHLVPDAKRQEQPDG